MRSSPPLLCDLDSCDGADSWERPDYEAPASADCCDNQSSLALIAMRGQTLRKLPVARHGYSKRLAAPPIAVTRTGAVFLSRTEVQ